MYRALPHAEPLTKSPPVTVPTPATSTVRSPHSSKTIQETTPQRQVSEKGYGISLGKIKGLKDQMREKVLNTQKLERIVITEENLKTGWEKVAMDLTAQKMIFRNAILKTQLSFEKQVIHLAADPMVVDFLREHRLDLLDFFKKFYQDPEVNILFEEQQLKETDASERVLSTREIFEKMAEKNPALRRLKDGLGMEFDL